MRAILCIGLVALLLGMPMPAQQKEEPKETPIKTTVGEILKNQDKFHKKLVQVEGKVTKFRKRTSRAGNAYTTFTLKQGNDEITVFSYGHLDLANDNEVIVIGRYYKEKRVGRDTFKNEIDASPKEGGKVMKKEASAGKSGES